MYSTIAITPASIQRYYEVEFAAQATFALNKLSSCLITFAQTGLKIIPSNLTVSNMGFRFNKVGILFEQTSGITITKCNVRNADDVEQGGITFSDCENVTATNLIIMNCRVGIRQHSTENAAISNCYFEDNTSKDVYNLYDNTCNISNCTFKNSNIAIDTSGRSNTIVLYCDINARIGLYNYAQTNWTSSFFTANNNNFDCTQHGVKTFAVFYTEYHLNATNNYWGTTSTATIYGDLIWDRTDEDPNHPDYWRLLGYVDYLPIKLSRVQNAGITLN